MPRSPLIDPNHDVCQSCHHKRWEHFGPRTACQAKGKAHEPKGPDSAPCTCAAFVERPPRKRKRR
jgi:hypothetical protein